MSDATSTNEAGSSKRAAADPAKHFGYQQQRSRDTFHRLIKAAEELIAGSSFDQTSVVEISELAGVSVGAFYRRFLNKEGLLQVVHERYTERMCRAQASMLDPAPWDGMSIEAILNEWVHAVTAATKRDLALIRASARRGQDDSTFAAREQRIYAESFAGMSRLLLRHIDEVRRPQPRTAIEFAVADMHAAFHQRLVMSHLRADHLTDDEWSRELVSSTLAYLDLKPTRRSRDRTSDSVQTEATTTTSS